MGVEFPKGIMIKPELRSRACRPRSGAESNLHFGVRAEPMLQELEVVKEQLAAKTNGDTRRFLDQMDSRLAEHRTPGQW